MQTMLLKAIKQYGLSPAKCNARLQLHPGCAIYHAIGVTIGFQSTTHQRTAVAVNV
jgi:hypothetical protein